MKRYQDASLMTNVKKIDSEGKEMKVRRLSTVMYPDFYTGNDTRIISQDGDRLDILAKEFYNDETLWYVIARANNLGKGSMHIPPGEIIIIPYETAMGISEMMTEFNRSR
jgi:nucleoid-associated protein YgaU